MSIPAKIKNNYKTFLRVVRDKNRKSLLKIFSEIIYLLIYYKSFPNHYFSRFLFKKDKLNIKDYIPNKRLHSIKPKFNDHEVIDVVENKLFFDMFYRQFNIPVPNILMYNHKKMFVSGSNTIYINNVQEFKTVIEDLIKNHTPDGTLFIKATYDSYGGDKVYKITLDQVGTDPALISELYFQVIKAGYLFQETIKQHPELDKLNPSCINTVRFDTFIDNQGKTEIISAFLRMSANNLYVDNTHKGGCFVGIDLNTGKLKREGFMELNNPNGGIILEHPVTHIVFEGFNVPYFKEAKDLMVRAASYMPGLRLVGWDMGISDSGPVLIEGNSDYGIIGNDLTEGGFLTNQVFRKIWGEIYNKN